MKAYLISLGMGILAGVVYSLMQIQSPAPPIVALLGLLGMLIGEQLPPIAKRLLSGQGLTSAWFRAECVPKITGAPAPEAATESEPGTTPR